MNVMFWCPEDAAAKPAPCRVAPRRFFSCTAAPPRRAAAAPPRRRHAAAHGKKRPLQWSRDQNQPRHPSPTGTVSTLRL